MYCIGHKVKDHLDSERGNPLPSLPWLLFSNSSKGSFICTIQETGRYIPRPLLHQSWSTGWNEKIRKFSCQNDFGRPNKNITAANAIIYLQNYINALKPAVTLILIWKGFSSVVDRVQILGSRSIFFGPKLS